ncbi:right-handed parallel beta-helix repeat-containing protein [Streptomyces sp. NPDC006512]|uniref:right-handed parallel beta-helix repeat-containing protein n=1 Tax=Streptomyces sp. NPDC006512 TaxID=3154307 RepID=UPI0033AA816D
MTTSAGRHRRTRTLPVAAVLALTAGAGGVYLAVAPGGGEAAAAGSARPVVVSTTAALERAFAEAGPGTTIQLRGGTYLPTRTLKSQADGTPTRRITVTAHGTEKVTVDGSKLPAREWLVAIGGDHWTLSNLTFRNSPSHGVVLTSSVGGVFKNLRTHGNGDSGFTLRGDGTNDNLIQNLDSHDNYDPRTHGQNADGLAIKFGSGTNNKVVGARLWNNADDGVDLWQWASPVRIENSWAYGNGENRWNDPAFEGNGNGFKLGGGGASAAHVVTGNAAWNNRLHGFTENSNPGALILHRNTAYANHADGFFFASSPSRLSRNLAAQNAGGTAKLGHRAVSAANSWDAKGEGGPFPDGRSFLRSIDATTAYGPRKADGSLPETTFLTTGTEDIGAAMK